MKITIEVPYTVAEKLLKKYTKKIWQSWRAEKGKKYWCVKPCGASLENECNDVIDNHRYLTGNYYQTEEEAHQAYQANFIIEAKGRLNLKMLELNNGWTPNWVDYEEWKFSPCYDYTSGVWRAYSWLRVRHLTDYHFPSEEIAKQFTKEMELDLNLVYNITI